MYFTGLVYKNTTENKNIINIEVYSFALNIQNPDGCYDGYQLETPVFSLLPFFLVLGLAVVAARVLLWGSGVAGGMAPG
jgi:hypothetical protein